MSYSIQNVAVMEDSLVTEVLYVLIDNSQQTINVTHFQPADYTAVITNITNKEAALNTVISAVINNIDLASTINNNIQAGTANGN